MVPMVLAAMVLNGMVQASPVRAAERLMTLATVTYLSMERLRQTGPGAAAVEINHLLVRQTPGDAALTGDLGNARTLYRQDPAMLEGVLDDQVVAFHDLMLFAGTQAKAERIVACVGAGGDPVPGAEPLARQLFAGDLLTTIVKIRTVQSTCCRWPGSRPSVG